MPKETITCPMCNGFSTDPVTKWCPVCKRDGTLEVDVEPRPEQTQTEGDITTKIASALGLDPNKIATFPPTVINDDGVAWQQEFHLGGRTFRATIQKDGRNTFQLETRSGRFMAVCSEMDEMSFRILASFCLDAARQIERRGKR